MNFTKHGDPYDDRTTTVRRPDKLDRNANGQKMSEIELDRNSRSWTLIRTLNPNAEPDNFMDFSLVNFTWEFQTCGSLSWFPRNFISAPPSLPLAMEFPSKAATRPPNLRQHRQLATVNFPTRRPPLRSHWQLHPHLRQHRQLATANSPTRRPPLFSSLVCLLAGCVTEIQQLSC